MPAAASGSAMAATSPFGYNPTGPDYGHYHQTMGGMGMDGFGGDGDGKGEGGKMYTLSIV